MDYFLSHASQPVHLAEAASDDVQVVKHALPVTNYSSLHPPQHVQSDEVVSDDDKVDYPRENVVLRPTVLSAPPHSSNDYSSQEETEDEAFKIPYMDEFDSSFDMFQHIDDNFFYDEQSDKTPFHDLIEEEESQTSQDGPERASPIVCFPQ